MQERLQALWSALPIIVLPVFIILSIYLGWVTPTETGAVAVAYVLALGLCEDGWTPRKSCELDALRR